MLRDGSGCPPRQQVRISQPAAQREQNGGESDRPKCPAHQSDEQSSPGYWTKRAQIGKASGYTHRSFRPDPVR